MVHTKAHNQHMRTRNPQDTDGVLIQPVKYNGINGTDYWLPEGTEVKFYFSGDTAHMLPGEGFWPDGMADRIVVVGARGRLLAYRYNNGATGPT